MQKKQRRRRLIAWLSAVLCLLPLLAVTAHGETSALPALDSADAVYLLHVESGRVMGRKSENTRVPAGASVKLLSGLVACERLGNSLDRTVIIREEMLISGGLRYKLEAGDEYSLRDILLLALCGSYNDAYDVIAYCVGNGGSAGTAESAMAGYVALLNARAKELGATATYIGDPTGVGDNSYTTAADLSRIALAAMKNDIYLSFVGLRNGETNDGKPFLNRNRLITDSQSGGVQYAGMCVGETNNAGVTLVALAKKANDSYLLVLLDPKDEEGAASETAAYRLARSLVRWGYANYTNLEVLSPKTKVCTVPVTVSDMVDAVDVRPSESLYAYLPVGSEVGKDVFLSIRLSVDELEAPVAEGTPVGFVAAVYAGQVIGTVPLETAESAERSGFVSRLLSVRNLTKSRRAKASVMFFVICMALWIGVEVYLRRRTKAQWNRYYSSKSRWR